jgi:hypothetical protein
MAKVFKLEIKKRTAVSNTNQPPAEPLDIAQIRREQIKKEAQSKREVELLNYMIDQGWDFCYYDNEAFWFFPGVDREFTTEEAIALQQKIDSDKVLCRGLKKLRNLIDSLEEK